MALNDSSVFVTSFFNVLIRVQFLMRGYVKNAHFIFFSYDTETK